MHVYVAISILLIEFFSDISIKNIDKSRKVKIILMSIIIFLFSALRAENVGADTHQYLFTFDQIKSMSFSDIFQFRAERDPVFSCFTRILAYISPNSRILLIAVAAVVAFGFGYFVYKINADPLIMFELFVCLRMYSFTLSGLRQSIAMVLCWFAFLAIYNKKYILFVLLAISASFFHISGLVFLITFPIFFIKKDGLVVRIVLILALFDLLTNQFLTSYFVRIVFSTRFGTYLDEIPDSTFSVGGTFIIYVLTFILTYFCYKRNRNSMSVQESENNGFLLRMASVGLAFSFMGRGFNIIFRIGYFFIFYLYVAISKNMFSIFNRKDGLLVRYLFIFILIVQYAILNPGAGIDNYSFFWQV